jgi:amidase
VLEVIAGPHRSDPLSLPRWQGPRFVATAVASLKVAYSPDLGTFPVAPAVTAAIETGLDALRAEGVRVEQVEMELPPHEELCQVLRRLFGLGLLDAVTALEREGIGLQDGEAAPDDGLLELLEQARALRAVDVKADEVRRTLLLDAFEDTLESHDAIVTPVTCVPAVRNSDDGRTVGPDQVEGRPVDPLLGWSLAYPVNLIGHPAASVPAGFSDGFPIGMQVIGRRFEEGTVMALAAAVERAAAGPALSPQG